MFRINLLKGISRQEGNTEPAAGEGKDKPGVYTLIAVVVVVVVALIAWEYMRSGRETDVGVTVVRLDKSPPPITTRADSGNEKPEAVEAATAPETEKQEVIPAAPAPKPASVSPQPDHPDEEEKTLALPSGRLPIVLHLASYSKEGSAAKDVRRLKMKGYHAFTSNFEITGKGTWYRVFSGRYSSVSQAKKEGATLIKSGLVAYANPLKLPYSLQVGVYSSLEKAGKSEERLQLLGHPATILEVEGDDGKLYYRLLVGAFKNKKGSEEDAARLKNDGYDVILAIP